CASFADQRALHSFPTRRSSDLKFQVAPSFYDWLKEFDSEKKIQIYKDDFYIPELSAIENDTRERTLLSEKMGVGNWLVQVDADEGRKRTRLNSSPVKSSYAVFC